MPDFLILRIQGVMQAWGSHTFEDYRPSELFPTRSGLVGLLGACLGIERSDFASIIGLSDSFSYAVRTDRRNFPARKITDYHTVLAARKVGGKPNENPVQSYREYLYDAQFTAALKFKEGATYTISRVTDALWTPVYTPVLGRRSCPLGQPIFKGIVEAVDLHEALGSIEPHAGTVYSEIAEGSVSPLRVRDVPLARGSRQFTTRTVYIHPEVTRDVPE